MDASSSQPKRTRKPIDRKVGAIFFVFAGIFFIVIRGSDVLRFLLPNTEIASPLAEFIVLLVALLWLGLMALLARYAKLLYRILFLLLFIPLIGFFIYLPSTVGSSDNSAFVIFNIIFGLMYLAIAPAFLSEHKLDYQAAPSIKDRKNRLRVLFVMLGLMAVWVSTHWMAYPSRFRLCLDVAEYVPLRECMALENNAAVMKRAFPVGEVMSEQVKAVLGDYLVDEGRVINTADWYQTYHLNITPVDTWNDRYELFLFLYDNNRVLKSIPNGEN